MGLLQLNRHRWRSPHTGGQLLWTVDYHRWVHTVYISAESAPTMAQSPPQTSRHGGQFHSDLRLVGPLADPLVVLVDPHRCRVGRAVHPLAPDLVEGAVLISSAFLLMRSSSTRAPYWVKGLNFACHKTGVLWQGRVEKNPILTYIIVYACNIRQYTSKGSFLWAESNKSRRVQGLNFRVVKTPVFTTRQLRSYSVALS